MNHPSIFLQGAREVRKLPQQNARPRIEYARFEYEDKYQWCDVMIKFLVQFNDVLFKLLQSCTTSQDKIFMICERLEGMGKIRRAGYFKTVLD